MVLSPWLKEAVIKKEIEKYNIVSFSEEEIQDNVDNKKPFSENASIEAPDFLKVLVNIPSVKREDVIGAIVIGGNIVSLPILHGTNTQNLLVGATTVKNDQVMGKGNYVLAGHHMRDDRLLFGPLLKIEKGTYIDITDKRQIFTYKVKAKKIVQETEVSVLEDTGSPRLTLITCDVTGIDTDKRVIITAELVDTNDNSNQDEFEGKYGYGMGTEPSWYSNVTYFLWVSLVVGLPCVLVLIMLIIKRRKDEGR
ncbi:class A sortase [Peribacillus simplex]|uniref:class A sortase n=1 Tax=Peribacillus simplex TaxID=1478 RepID=UPI00203AAC9E|nr:class A sortase [Peribacillus simplex]MCM3675951.1 class A sortase [Peribacillus simplex]